MEQFSHLERVTVKPLCCLWCWLVPIITYWMDSVQMKLDWKLAKIIILIVQERYFIRNKVENRLGKIFFQSIIMNKLIIIIIITGLYLKAIFNLQMCFYIICHIQQILRVYNSLAFHWSQLFITQRSYSCQLHHMFIRNQILIVAVHILNKF